MLKSWLKKWLKKILETDTFSLLVFRLSNQLFVLPTIDTHPLRKKRYQQQLWQGLINNRIIPYYLHRTWPFWVYQQYLPSSPNFSVHSNPLSANNTSQRNWTALGHPHSENSIIVDPKGLITPLPQTWSLDFWLANLSKLISSAQLSNIQQNFSPNSMSCNTECTLDGLSVNSEVLFKSLPKNENMVLNKVTLANTSKNKINFSFFFSIRPYNPEGLAPIKEIVFLTSNAFMIDHRLAAVFDTKPDNIVCLAFKDGDVSEIFNKWEMILNCSCSHNLASAFVEYKLSLAPNEKKTLTCKLPTKQATPLFKRFQKTASTQTKKKINTSVGNLNLLSYDIEKDHLEKELEPLYKNSMTLDIPNTVLTKLWRQNKAHLIQAIGEKCMYPGSLTSRVNYIEANATLIRALDTIGFHKLSAPLIRHLPFQLSTLKKQSLDLPFDIGQIIVTLYHHCNLENNHALKKELHPYISKLIKHIEKSSIDHMNKMPYLNGLMKKGLSDEHSGIHHYYIWDNYWALKACYLTLDIATKNQKLAIQTTINKIEKGLNALYLNIQNKKAFLPIIPITPTQFTDPRLLKALSCVYPLNLMPPKDIKVTHSLTWLEKNYTINNVLFSHSSPIGLATEMNCQLALLYLQRNDQKALTILTWLSNCASQTGCWPEALHPTNLGGCFGEGHDIRASASFLTLLKECLVKESGTTLELLPMIPEAWLYDQKPIIVKNCPTSFGPLSFIIKKKDPHLELTITQKFHKEPTKITICLSKKLAKTYVNNRLFPLEGTQIVLSPKTKKTVFEFT